MSINFMIPGLYEHFNLLQRIITYYEKNINHFIDGFTIGAIYGDFQYCIWDGGRNFSQYLPCSLEQILDIKNYFNDKGIPIRLIYTNPILEEKHLYDRFCNLVTEVCESPLNEIVINSPLLEHYIKMSYPNYSFISSTTKCNSKEESLKELDSYKMICLDYNLNKNEKYLSSIPEDKRSKIELLCNAICPPGCPNRKNHYSANGQFHLTLAKPYQVDCGIKTNTCTYATRNYYNNISPDEIQNKYLPMGYNNFKLEGRSLSDYENLLNIAYYCIKPEYQHEFILDILMTL